MLHTRLPLAFVLALAFASPALAAENAPSASSGWSVTAARWFTPAMAGTTQFDYGFARPSGSVRFTRWNDAAWPANSFTADLTVFGATDTPTQAGAIPANGLMGDLKLERRWLDNRLIAGVGLRALGFQRVTYGTLSARYEQPLGPEWLSLQAEGLAGTNINLAYTLDASAGLQVRGGSFSALAGFRTLLLHCGCGLAEPPLSLSGPVLQAGYQF